MEVAGAAARAEAPTLHGFPSPSSFLLGEVPNDSNQIRYVSDSSSSRSSSWSCLFLFALAIKLGWEVFSDRFYLHVLIISAVIFQFGEVAARCLEIFEFQSYAFCQITQSLRFFVQTLFRTIWHVPVPADHQRQTPVKPFQVYPEKLVTMLIEIDKQANKSLISRRFASK